MLSLQDKVNERTAAQLHELGPITRESASQVGALDHWRCICSCGLEICSTVETGIRRDMFDHVDYWRGRGLRDRLAKTDRTRGWLA